MSTQGKKYKYDYKKIKQDISLPNFVRDVLGWMPADGYSTNNPKFKSLAGDKVIIISMGTQGYHTYFDAKDSSLNGGKSVFDLYQEHYKQVSGKDMKLPEVAKRLLDYIEEGKTIKPKDSEFRIEQRLHDTNYVASVIRGCNPVIESDFLTKRGVNLEILKEKGWANVFLERMRSNKNKTDRDGQPFYFKNICVRMFNTEGIQALSERNDKFKGIDGGRADCIASSSIVDRSKPIEKAHLFESMIDAVSYYQMNYYDMGDKDKNVIFISSEGALTVAQIGTIQNAIDKYNIPKIELNFDNDIAGLKYSLNTVANLQLSGQANDSVRFISISEKAVDEDNASIFISAIVKESDTDKAYNLIDKIFSKDTLEEYYERSRYSISHTHTSPDQAEQHFTISIPRNKELLCDLVNNFIEFKFDKSVELKLPFTKDFNDDLKLNNENIKTKEPLNNNTSIDHSEGFSKIGSNNNQISM